ncbi:MAG: HD domain-containing protein [Coriobacteriia bacterium]|nr:HD domain-containing protein [Coriobacteriia bacterium]
MGTDSIYNYGDDIEFRVLDSELEAQIKEDRSRGWKNPKAFDDKDVIRRVDKPHDRATVMRSAFDRDIEKIMYLPAYNRYNNKTQVFSFINNDDVSRRGLHVQYVSKIARNIGEILGLNTKLIEAIALGHDIGHTPFGHAGEYFLNEVYHSNTGRYFRHNVHSVRVLDKLFKRNLSLQTLDGILCHNGEICEQKLEVENLNSFDDFDKKFEMCYTDKDSDEKLKSSTLEACVVRISDIIAYLGKDRIDALLIGVIDNIADFDSQYLGRENTKIINNMMVDVIENSYGKDHIELSKIMYDDLLVAQKQNYEKIYNVEGMYRGDKLNLHDMIDKLYNRFLDDFKSYNQDSFIFKHHFAGLIKNSSHFILDEYLAEDIHQIVVDYLASMTDTYFMSIYEKLFPEDKKNISFRGY